MKRYLFILLSVMSLSGCALKREGKLTTEQEEFAKLQYRVTSDDMDTFYNEDGMHRWHYPPDASFTESETAFYIEGNACIVSDYILGKLLMNASDIMMVTLGPNCFDTERNDGIVMIRPADITIENQGSLAVNSQIRIYYEFPEGFVPDDYLDYLDYAIRITSNES